jgi:hypothetical protein
VRFLCSLSLSSRVSLIQPLPVENMPHGWNRSTISACPVFLASFSHPPISRTSFFRVTFSLVFDTTCVYNHDHFSQVRNLQLIRSTPFITERTQAVLQSFFYLRRLGHSGMWFIHAPVVSSDPIFWSMALIKIVTQVQWPHTRSPPTKR